MVAPSPPDLWACPVLQEMMLARGLVLNAVHEGHAAQHSRGRGGELQQESCSQLAAADPVSLFGVRNIFQREQDNSLKMHEIVFHTSVLREVSNKKKKLLVFFADGKAQKYAL